MRLAFPGARRARAPFVPVQSAGQPRSTVWGLSIPLVMAARALGLTNASDEVLEATARRLEDVAHRCRPDSESFVNPAKQIALDMAGSLPMVWGTSDLAAVAAKLEHGDGTLGKLVNDPSLYRQAQGVLEGVRRSWVLRMLGAGGKPPPDTPAVDAPPAGGTGNRAPG